MTGEDGAYRFRGVPPGEYRLRVSRLGYRAMTLWVELPPAWRVRRSLALRVEPIELAPLRYTAGGAFARWPRGRARAVSVGRWTSAGLSERPTLDARALTPGEVRAMATLGEPDLLRALQRLPGVSGRGDYSAAPWMRGAPWGFTQVTLDGLPLYDPFHLGGAGTALAADGLEAAYLLPGARPAAHSEGAAGTLHLVSRTARAEGGTSLAASSVALRAHAEDRWLRERVGLALTGRRSWWDLLRPGFLSGGSAGPFDYHFADLAGRLDVRVGEGGTIEAGGLWEEDRIDGDVGDLVSESRGRWGNRSGWVALDRSFGSSGIRATIGRSAYSLRTGPRPWASFRSSRGIPSLDRVELDLSRRVLRLEAAGELPQAPVEWNAGFERVAERLAQFGSEAWDRGAPGVDGEAVAERSRGWAEGTVRLGSLRLATGAALDLSKDLPLPGGPVRPSVRLRWEGPGRLKVELARSRNRQFAYPVAPAGRAFGPDLRVGHVWVLAGDGRPSLTSDVTTLGLEVRLPGELTGGVTAWRRRSSGLWTRGVSTLVEGSRQSASPEGGTGKERAEGLEILVRRDGSRISGEASYTWTDAEMQGDAGRIWSSPAERRHSVDAVVGSRIARGLRAATLFRAESGWPYAFGPWTCERFDPVCTSPENLARRPASFSFRRSPGYVSLDLVLDWTKRGERLAWRASASLRNVLGQENPAAYRAASCFGAELVSMVCEKAVGAGGFSRGLTGLTPAVAVELEF